MQLDEVLRQAVNAFHITVDGESFWAPYLRNDNFTQDASVPRGLGKASADEIKVSAEYIKSLFPTADGEMIRQKLVDGSLPEKHYNYKGIDCSGFTYFVMDQVYKELLGTDLMDDLSVPKSHVLNGAYNLDEWKAAYTLSKDQAEELPEDVPMRWVVETFHRNPVNLCRVAGLASDYSSVKIDPLDSIVGDLVHMIAAGQDVPHIGIILERRPESVLIIHSGRENSIEIGGVETEEVALSATGIVTSNMKSPRDFLGVRRLRSLTK